MVCFPVHTTFRCVSVEGPIHACPTQYTHMQVSTGNLTTTTVWVCTSNLSATVCWVPHRRTLSPI